jgi:ABC-type Fe3+-hydroxamate transport system substrate-binding protein
MPVYFDQLNRKIDIPNKPKRIVSLVPSITHLLHKLKLINELVGITKFCVDPPELRSKIELIGGTKKQDIRKIRNLEPDLIIANKEENKKETIERLSEFAPVWVSEVNSVSDSIALVFSIGKICNREEEANKIIESISVGFAKVKKRARRFLINPTAGYFIWQDPYMVAGHNNIINSIMKYMGLTNVFNTKNNEFMQKYVMNSRVNHRYPIVNDELIQLISPKYILLSSEPFPFKEKHIAQFKEILPSAEIMLVPGEMFSWYGAKLIKSTEYLLNLQTILLSKS